MFGDKKMIGPVPSYVVDEQVKARFKFQSLMQEYNDLHKESEEKRMTILGAKRRRNILLAEVGFLRQRFEQLMEYQDVAQVKHIQRTPSHPTPVLDLNQIAKDEEDEIQVNDVVEPMKMEKISINFSVSGSHKPPLPPRQKDLKLSVCRDIQKGPNRAGKRKISIQDVLTLRV